MISERLCGLDWDCVAGELDAYGCAATGPLLTAEACAALTALYDQDIPLRRRVVMAQHGFGRGEYKYFAYPLPEIVQALRGALYAQLVPMARRWAERLGQDVAYPDTHGAYVAQCHAQGQTRPTPLLLRYGPGVVPRVCGVMVSKMFSDMDSRSLKLSTWTIHVDF